MKTTLEVKDKFKESDSLKIASFKQHIRKTSPHKHNNYFEIICLTHGSGFHTIDTKQYEIQPPIVFTVRKEQVHFWDITSAPQGFVIIIKKSFIDYCLDQEIKRLISELSSQNCLFLQDNYVLDIYALLQKEFDLKASSNQLVIEALLKAFLAKLLESAVPNRTKSSNSSTFQKYIDLLSQKEQLSNKVSYFAQLLK